jgi:hypothetical protein
VRRSLLEKAAEEFLAEGYEYQTAAKILEKTAPEHLEEARRKLLPPRTVPDGCFVWLSYLIWLDDILEVVPGLQLLASEAEGLLVLRRARNRFLNTHPPCPHCGLPNEAHADRCRECMGEIK